MRAYTIKNPKYIHIFKYKKSGETYTIESLMKDIRYSEYKLLVHLDCRPSDLIFVNCIALNPPNTVKCIDCENLEITLPYGVCGKGYKGIVDPNDSCGKGKLRNDR